MRHSHSMLNVDVLALALFTCLFASVISILVIDEDGKAGDNQRSLHDQIQLLSSAAAKIQDDQQILTQRIAKRANLLGSERDLRIEQSVADGLRREIAAREKIAKAKTDITRLNSELAKLKQIKNRTKEQTTIVGNYKGPYILIECLKGYALVYPGKIRLAKKPKNKDIKQLIDRITKAGFVAFVVRPGGWVGDSFDSLKSIIDPMLDKYDANSSAPIGRTWVPVEAKEPIDKYLPPDLGSSQPTATGSNRG